MIVAFTLQSTNINKHPQMPVNYPFTVYEVDDSRQAEFEAQGFTVLSINDFNTYKNSIDISAYTAAMAPTVSQIIDTSLSAAQIKGKELTDKFKRENIMMGISDPALTATLVAVVKKCHWIEHLLLQGTLRGAIYEMDSVIASDLTGLAPFVTVARVTDFKHQVQDFLGIARS